MKWTSLWMMMMLAAATFAAAVEQGEVDLDDVEANLADANEIAAKAEAAAWATAKRYRWDGKESVADYAARVGIKDVEVTLDLGSGVSMKLTLIPAGTFIMGARPREYAVIDGVPTLVQMHDFWSGSWEFARREVTISQPFYMGVHEVTQGQYLQIMKKIEFANRKKLQAEGNTLPVDGVPWKHAVEFCEKVSALTGRTVTLPTEAQWEYACRAGTKTKFWFGDDDRQMYKNENRAYSADYFQKLAAFEAAVVASGNQDAIPEDGFEGYAPVGSLKPNPWGLYDMHGNVAEHCSDWAHHDSTGCVGPKYGSVSRLLDPKGPPIDQSMRYHVWRGGIYGSIPGAARSATRPFHNGDGFGFRVVMTLK